ncbi:hypothetical protein [Streptomyces sp. NPDC056544]
MDRARAHGVAQAVAMAGHSGSPNPHRLLWNLPLMVSLGPQSPATDRA